MTVNQLAEDDNLNRTIWARSFRSQLSRFLRTESGSSGVLLLGIVGALVWANLGAASYEWFWKLPLDVDLSGIGISLDLRGWVSSGLMTLFFLVVGLEARREFDLGALRERRQFVIPFAAGLAGMAIPVAIFLAVTAGQPGQHGWGVAMSTDTALALGLMTLLGRGLPERIRGFVLTVFIVDDLVALLVIAIAYASDVQPTALLVAAVAFALILIGRRVQFLRGVTVLLALVSWVALLFSGVDPIVLGLAVGLITPAYSPDRHLLEKASGTFRQFREQPTPALARSAAAGMRSTLSPNELMQTIYHPWTSYLIVPLFALANAGISLDPKFLAAAVSAPVTVGVFLGYVVGKPVAIFGVTAIMTRLTHGRLRPPVGWAAVAGSGTIAGVGFTVAVLVASLAFTGSELEEAKLGILAAATAASIITWLVFRITAVLPPAVRTRALLGAGTDLPDLVASVEGSRDHIRGSLDAVVTVVEYGDFECPFCGKAEASVRELLDDEEVRFVWRHLPISDVHPNAQLAAEAAEAAAAQGAFWPMHDLLLTHQHHLAPTDLDGYAAQLGLDVSLFHQQLTDRLFRNRVEEDVRSADLSGASGTPTFFINGRRHYGAYDAQTLRKAVMTARDQAYSRETGAFKIANIKS
jgi:Na+/H+ antiporter NhaA